MVPCTWALQTCDTCDNLLQVLGLVPIFCYAFGQQDAAPNSNLFILLIPMDVTPQYYFAFFFIVMTCLY